MNPEVTCRALKSGVKKKKKKFPRMKKKKLIFIQKRREKKMEGCRLQIGSLWLHCNCIGSDLLTLECVCHKEDKFQLLKRFLKSPTEIK